MNFWYEFVMISYWIEFWNVKCVPTNIQCRQYAVRYIEKLFNFNVLSERRKVFRRLFFFADLEFEFSGFFT